MTIRTELLRRIVPVPEALVIQADEYLFTIAAVLSQAVVLSEPLTFYRHHSSNLFIISANDPARVRSKLVALQALSREISARLCALNVEPKTRKIIVETVEMEARHLRLAVDGGWPWETIATELQILRILHGDASLRQYLFSLARLVPALALPPRTYYRWRQKLARGSFYQGIRRRYFPFPVPEHVNRQEKKVP